MPLFRASGVRPVLWHGSDGATGLAPTTLPAASGGGKGGGGRLGVAASHRERRA
jgi:hypothetical protein